MIIDSENLAEKADTPSPKVRVFCLMAAVTITCLLFYLGAQPFAVDLFPEPWDKLAHLLVFASIAGLLAIATAGRVPLFVFCIVATIGVFDELHQSTLPGRSMDLADLLTDIVAAALAIAIGILVQQSAQNERACERAGSGTN